MHRTSVKIGHFLRRCRLLACALVLFFCWAGLPRSQDGTSLTDVLHKLNPEEAQKAVDDLATKLPISVLGEEDGQFANDMIAAGKTASDYAEKISQGKHKEVGREIGRSLANATKKELVAQIEKRFDDPDSPVRKMLSSVQNNPEAYSKAARAVLNGDLEAATTVVGDEINKHAASTYDDLVQEGKDYWKGLAEEVIPGSDVLKKHGIDPVDTYVQGVEDWTEFVKDAKQAKDAYVFDCLHRRYTAAKTAHGSAAALDEVRQMGLAGFDCVTSRRADAPYLEETPEERANRDVLRGIAGMYRDAREATQRLTRETSTLAEYGTDLDEMADLIEAFEKGVREGSITRQQARGGFSNWVRKEIAGRRPKSRSRRASKVPQSGFAKVLWDMKSALSFPVNAAKKDLADFMSAVALILTDTFGKKKLSELTGLPEEDFLPKEEVEPIDEAKKETEADKQRKKQEQAAKEVEKELKCNPEYQKKSKGGLDPEFIPQETADKGPGYVDEEGCRPYGPAQRFDYIVSDENNADPGKADREHSKHARLMGACPHLASAVDTAGAQYAKGEIEAARATLQGVRAQLDADSATSACPELRARVVGNLGKIQRMADLLADLQESLTECAPQPLRRYHQQLATASHVSLVAARERLLRSVRVAEKYTLAAAAYNQGRIDDAGILFRMTLAAADAAGKPTCVDIEKRSHSNLRRIEQMQELKRVVTATLDRCDMAGIQQHKSRLVGSTNPFLVELHTRLSNPPARCLRRIADEDCATKFGGGWTSGPPDEKGAYYCRPPNKTAANQWCEENSEGSGWVAGDIADNGSFKCLPSYARQRSAALADCRRQHGSRLIKVFRSKGNWYCSYRSKTAKGKARRPRAARRRGGGGYDPRAAAAAAAIAGAVIQGIVRSQSGGHGHGGGNCAVNPRAPGC